MKSAQITITAIFTYLLSLETELSKDKFYILHLILKEGKLKVTEYTFPFVLCPGL